MKSKKYSIIITSIVAMILGIGLIGCSKKVDQNESTEASNAIVESTPIAESETATTETVANTETTEAIENEVTSSEAEIIDPNYNGSHYEGTLEETIQSYITYEDIEPTTMYVISGNKDESYAIYNDPNVTEGVLMMGGLLSANEEVTIDGKATFNNTEYYRLAHNDGAMVNFQYIIPAEYVTTEKQEPPIEQPTETQKPVEPQQPTEQQPTEDQPSTTPEAPAYDPSSGVSEEDWNKVFGIGGGGNINWQPDNPEGFSSERNDKGGFTITGHEGEVGHLTFE